MSVAAVRYPIRTAILACLCACLAGGSALAGTKADKVPEPPKKVYSPAQKDRAEAAITAVARALDQLDQRMAAAYGDAPSILRDRRIKEGEPLNTGHSAVTTDEPPAGTVSAGGRVLIRLGSYEPLLAACGLTSETGEALDILADEVGALLEIRKEAKPAERADWARTGMSDGKQRLRQVHELNCVPVRHGLADGLPALQSAYTQLHGVRVEEPEQLVEPKDAKTALVAANTPAPAVAGTAAKPVPAAPVPVAPVPTVPVPTVPATPPPAAPTAPVPAPPPH